MKTFRQKDKLTYLISEPAIKGSDSPAALVLLHGYKENAEKMFRLSGKLKRDIFLISIQAPIKIAKDSYAWCHVEFTTQGPVDDPCEAEESRIALVDLLQTLPQSIGIDRRDIFLCGFSQGAIMSLSLALTMPESFGGAISLSGRIIPEYLPLLAGNEQLKGFPILLINGLEDQLLPIRHARAARQALAELPVALEWYEIHAGHNLTEEHEIILADWLSRQRMKSR
jgi:phospholipase/carboxylesterase